MTRVAINPRIVIRRAGFLGVFLAGALAPLGLGRLPHAGWVVARRETQRRPAPDLRHDAVVVETRSQLISSRVTYEVYIVAHAMDVRKVTPVLTATNAPKLRIIWQTSSLAEIDYRTACIEQFSSYWPHSRTHLGPPVEIRLVPSSQGFACLTLGPSTPPWRMPLTP